MPSIFYNSYHFAKLAFSRSHSMKCQCRIWCLWSQKSEGPCDLLDHTYRSGWMSGQGGLGVPEPYDLTVESVGLRLQSSASAVSCRVSCKNGNTVSERQ